MDKPTAALGVRESGEVLNLIRTIRDRGLPVKIITGRRKKNYSTF
jgi:fructose transport system ATP-binding protein